ncbi:MAG: hypothetical protein ABI645_01240 [Pseudomonadota bacterium]
MAFLILAVAGVTSASATLAAAAYPAMAAITEWGILPLSMLSALSGIASSIVTEWGLFRYYWVAVKLAITALSIAALAAHLETIERLTTVLAARPQNQMIAAATAALVILVFLVALSVVKPRGRISRRKLGT